MTSTGQDFTMYSGDSNVITITVTDSAGAAKDLSGAAIVWSMAPLVESEKTTIEKTNASGIAITGDGSAGIFTVTLAAADTAPLRGDYYHEAKITDGSNNVSTVTIGKVTVIETLT